MADHQGQPDPTPTLSSTAPPPAPSPLAALPDAASSTTTQPTNPAPDAQPTLADPAGVDNGDAYAKLREEFLATAPEPPGEPAATTPTPETPAPETPPAPANETNEPPPAEDLEGDDTKIPDRIRLGGLTEKDRGRLSAAVLLAKAEGIPVDEAMARISGKPATPAEPAPTDPAAIPAPTLRPPDAIQAHITELEAQADQAALDADTVKLNQLHREIRKAEREMEQSQVAIQQQAQQFDSTVKTARSQARLLYPALKDPASPLAKKWSEVAARLEANNDPLYANNDPRFPLVVSQMAAAELGIAPVDPKAKPPLSAVVPTSTPTPVPPANAARPVQPAPGSARSAAPANPTGQLETRLAGVKTTDSYEELKKELFQDVA